MAKKKAKTTTRGKRYTPEEKVEILTFVDKHNATNGRGGAAAASRKFNISQLTIGTWLRQAGSPPPRGKKSSVNVDKALKRLGELHKQMSKLETQLQTLRKEYASLKMSI